MADSQPSEGERFYGGVGLACMAMRLAEERAGERLQGFWTRHRMEPIARSLLNPAIHAYSREYYYIIDRIARGEQP